MSHGIKVLHLLSSRDLRLVLRRDRSAFSNDFVATDSKGFINLDLSHIYSGTLEGDPGSRVFGSLINGVFNGRISTGDSQEFFVEPSWKYFNKTQSQRVGHSVIYSGKD
ncbi:unnamed protein product, partial [Ixodes persulcatus]